MCNNIYWYHCKKIIMSMWCQILCAKKRSLNPGELPFELLWFRWLSGHWLPFCQRQTEVLAKLGVTTAKHARHTATADAYICVFAKLIHSRALALVPRGVLCWIVSTDEASECKEFPIWPLSFPGELRVPLLRGKVISPVCWTLMRLFSVNALCRKL